MRIQIRNTVAAIAQTAQVSRLGVRIVEEGQIEHDLGYGVMCVFDEAGHTGVGSNRAWTDTIDVVDQTIGDQDVPALREKIRITNRRCEKAISVGQARIPNLSHLHV